MDVLMNICTKVINRNKTNTDKSTPFKGGMICRIGRTAGSTNAYRNCITDRMKG